jgi:hypothetical protein
MKAATKSTENNILSQVAIRSECKWSNEKRDEVEWNLRCDKEASDKESKGIVCEDIGKERQSTRHTGLSSTSIKQLEKVVNQR